MEPIPLARICLFAILLVAPSGAFAQGQPGPANPPGAGEPAAAPAAPDTATPGRRESLLERHIRTLHARLRITPEQEGTWEQFTAVMRENARTADQANAERQDRLRQNLSAIDNLQSYAALALAHAQGVQRLVPAFQAVYNSFSPEQRALADQLFRNRAERIERRMSHRD